MPPVPGADATSIGTLVLSLAALGSVVALFGNLFVLRREHVSTKEDHGRRLEKLEELDPPSAQTFLDHARRNADHHVHIERQVSQAQTELRSEFNHGLRTLSDKLTEMERGIAKRVSDVDRNLGALETETRLQSKTLDKIAEKMGVPK